jgi:hypothetical protein
VDPLARIVAQLLPESVVFWATARALERLTGDPRATVIDALTELSEGLPKDRKLLVLPVLRGRPSPLQINAIRRALPGLHIYPRAEGED